MVQNINVEYILNLDTTIKVGDGGVCFTLGGTRNIPVIAVKEEEDEKHSFVPCLDCPSCRDDRRNDFSDHNGESGDRRWTTPDSADR